MEEACEYPDCDADEDIHTYGFTIDGMMEREKRYCFDHAPTADVIEP